MTLLEPVAPRRRPSRVRGVVLVLLLVIGVGAAISWRLLGGAYRIAVLSPDDGTLVASTFRVDVALSGTRRPDEIEITLDGRVVGRAKVPEDRWIEPGSAILTDVTADVSNVPPGWYTMSARVAGGPLSTVESGELRVRVADASALEPATPAQIEAVRTVFGTLLPKAVVTLDGARRLDRETWTQDGVWKTDRDAVLAAPVPPEIGGALKELFSALEAADDPALVVAGDLLNLSLERRAVPHWATVNGTTYGDGRRDNYVLTYALEEPIRLQGLGQVYEALSARRLDTLNIEELLLGHRTTGVARAVLLVDNIEEKAHDLVRCLREGTAKCALRWAGGRVDFAISEEAIEAAVGAMRRELAAFTGAACAAPEADACHAAVARLLLVAVAHHEVRHVIDHRRGLPLARGVGAMLADLRSHYHVRDKRDLKSRLDLEVASYNTVSGANQEASAYIAEVAEGAGLRHFNALQLVAFACDRRFDGTDEAWAGRSIVAGLAGLLGAGGSSLVTTDPSDPAWSEAVAAIAKLPSEELGRRAAELYAVEHGSYDPVTAAK